MSLLAHILAFTVAAQASLDVEVGVRTESTVPLSLATLGSSVAPFLVTDAELGPHRLYLRYSPEVFVSDVLGRPRGLTLHRAAAGFLGRPDTRTHFFADCSATYGNLDFTRAYFTNSESPGDVLPITRRADAHEIVEYGRVDGSAGASHRFSARWAGDLSFHAGMDDSLADRTTEIFRPQRNASAAVRTGYAATRVDHVGLETSLGWVAFEPAPPTSREWERPDYTDYGPEYTSITPAFRYVRRLAPSSNLSLRLGTLIARVDFGDRGPILQTLGDGAATRLVWAGRVIPIGELTLTEAFKVFGYVWRTSATVGSLGFYNSRRGALEQRALLALAAEAEHEGRWEAHLRLETYAPLDLELTRSRLPMDPSEEGTIITANPMLSYRFDNTFTGEVSGLWNTYIDGGRAFQEIVIQVALVVETSLW